MNTLTIRPDRSLIRSSDRSVRYALVTVQAPVKARTTERLPIDVAFVLDRSGSMGGQKIVLAREAVLQGIGMLRPDDRFTVVAYDNEIDVVMPLGAATGTARAAAEALVRAIEARGSTDLGGGWLRGCHEMATHQQAGRAARCLLMSDGQANQGITDPEELARHAAALRERGIVTSTFGVGDDFDELLMSGMSRAGGGNNYFMASGAQVADLLTSELGEGLETVARGVTLSLTVPRGVDAEVLSDFPAEPGDEDVRVALGDLVSGQELSIVVRLAFPTGAEGGTVSAGAALDDGDHVLAAPMAGVSWTWASHAENDAQRRDREVDIAVATIYAARARRDAVDMNRRGQFAQAGRLLEAVARKIESYATGCSPLLEIATRLRREAHHYRHEMSARARKDSYYASMSALRARSSSGKARRTSFDAETFAVQLQGGVPVFDCHGMRVLLHTGSPRSVGHAPIAIAGEVYPLQPAFDGLSIDDIAPYVGGRLDALVGTDLLQRYQWLLDLSRGQVVFCHGELPFDGVALRVPLVSGVPCADVVVHGRQGRAVLDTGARISYMLPGLFQHPRVGREQDFHPAVGRFETDVYVVDVEFAGLRFRGRFGVLPDALHALLAAAGAEWVVGTELLAQFPFVFDLAHGRMKIVQEDVTPFLAAL